MRDVTTDRDNETYLGMKRAKVWQAFDAISKLVEKPTLIEIEFVQLKMAIKIFIGGMINAWGETHITHYMVSLQSWRFLQIISN